MTAKHKKACVELAVPATALLAVWAAWPIVGPGSPGETPMQSIGDVPWLATILSVVAWTLVTWQSLIAQRPDLKSPWKLALGISLSLATLLLAGGVLLHWSWAFTMCMHFVGIILALIGFRLILAKQ